MLSLETLREDYSSLLRPLHSVGTCGFLPVLGWQDYKFHELKGSFGSLFGAPLKGIYKGLLQGFLKGTIRVLHG